MSPRRNRRRASLRGCTKWLPFLIMPFAALLFETWLHIETLDNDYDAEELNGQIRSLERRIEGLEEKELRLRRLARIRTKAANLELIEPQPGQTHRIYYSHRDGELIIHKDPYEVARLEGDRKAFFSRRRPPDRK